MNESPAVRLAAALLTLAGITLMLLAELPPWQRELLARAVRQRIRRAVAGLARASGRRAMSRELGGTPQQAAGYDRTYRISLLRDRM